MNIKIAWSEAEVSFARWMGAVKIRRRVGERKIDISQNQQKIAEEKLLFIYPTKKYYKVCNFLFFCWI
ncbi:hypothetical protein Leryth_012590 [Lithospermum erythrorhizon]|nr:hypothetical protein Leryth_012590 [Lithospermum erythrorhizon]